MRKINSVVREVLADEIERMSDQRLEMVSVTGVDTRSDLRTAVVFYDVLGSDNLGPAGEALQGAARRLQSAIGRKVRMKYTPVLEFVPDQGIIQGERIDSILRDLGSEDE